MLVLLHPDFLLTVQVSRRGRKDTKQVLHHALSFNIEDPRATSFEIFFVFQVKNKSERKQYFCRY